MKFLSALALGLALGSCAIQPAGELYEVTEAIYTSPETVDVYSGHGMTRTDILITDHKILLYTPQGPENKLKLSDWYVWDDVVDYTDNQLTLQLAKDCTVTYFLFDLENHYE